MRARERAERGSARSARGLRLRIVRLRAPALARTPPFSCPLLPRIVGGRGGQPMTLGQTNRVLLCADSGNGADEVRQVLANAGYQVGLHALNGSDLADPRSANLIVLEGSAAPEMARTVCRRLRNRLGEVFVPI